MWWAYRGADFKVRGQEWLRQATFASLVGGVLWGLGSLFLFPPGLLMYQFTFMIVLVMMAIAAMFSYAPHYRTLLVYLLPSTVPGVIALELQREVPQQAMGVGLVLMMGVVLVSVRTYNRMFLESMSLKLEKLISWPSSPCRKTWRRRPTWRSRVSWRPRVTTCGSRSMH